MKKILALALALALMLCLVPGALAYDEDTGIDYDTWLETWKAANPQLVSEILKDEPPLWEDQGYASKDEMLSDWDMSESEYADMVVYDRAWDTYYDEYYTQEFENWIADTREELGGEREGLGVMLGGEYIDFPDATPELTGGRTMIPLRALMEAMGAEVSYQDDGTVTCILNGTTISFKVGDTQVTAEKDGVTSAVAMDCASYIKDSRTYVPVRFFSEAAGYDVLWDSDFQTAVVLDRQSMIDAIDENFSIINKAMASEKLSGTYKTALNVSAVITAFSTLDGNTTSSVRGSVTVISDGKSQHVSAVMDVYGLLEIVGKALDTDIGAQLTPEEITALKNVSFEMIVNYDEGVSYIKCPLLLEILGAEDAQSWLKSDPLEDQELLDGNGTFVLAQAQDTYGATVYNTALDDTQSYDYPVFAQKNIELAAQRAAQVLGDSAFTNTGSGYSTDFDRDDYEVLTYGQLPEESSYYDYKELDVRLTVSNSGGVNGSFTVRETGGDTRYTGTLSLTPRSLSLNMEIHVDNTMKVQLTVSSSTQSTAETIPTAPPAGSTVITSDDLSVGITGIEGIGG